jgi:hypothetical protein
MVTDLFCNKVSFFFFFFLISDGVGMYDASIPSNVRVPDNHFEGSTQTQRSQVKAWVIKTALEKSADKVIGMQKCEKLFIYLWDLYVQVCVLWSGYSHIII